MSVYTFVYLQARGVTGAAAVAGPSAIFSATLMYVGGSSSLVESLCDGGALLRRGFGTSTTGAGCLVFRSRASRRRMTSPTWPRCAHHGMESVFLVAMVKP